MSLVDQPSLLQGIQNWLQRTDIVPLFVDFVTLFEAAANRRLRVKQQEASTVLTPLTTASVNAGGSNLSYGPLGECVLTVGDGTPSSVAGFSSGDTVIVTGVVGLTEANGTWPINVISSGGIGRIVLIGTVIVNVYVSGGTVTNTGSVALPSDFLTWRKVQWLGQPNRTLEFTEPSYFSSEYPDVPQDIPSIFTIQGSVLKLMPQDKTPIQLLYWQKIPALTAAAPTNWLMTAYPDLYLFGSLVEASAYTRDSDAIQLWRARREELFDEIDKLDKKSRAPGRIRVMSPTP